MMNQWSVNIEGNYLDSFIYMGLLFLVDFDGMLNVYDFEKLLSSRLKNEEDNLKNEFIQIFSKKKTNNRCFSQTKNFSSQIKRSLNIDLKLLKKFELDNLDIEDWVTNINVTSKSVYFSSGFGLKKCRININEKSNEYGKLEKEKIFTLFDDTKVYSFASSAQRNVLCCGDEGAIYNVEEKNKFKYITDNKSKYWIDCQWYSLDKFDILSINNSKDILAMEVKLEKNIRELLNRIRRIKDKIISKEESDIHRLRLEKIEKLLPECFKGDLENTDTNNVIKDMTYFKERNLRNFGLFYQENENLFFKKTSSGDDAIPIVMGREITNWRIFPNARTHFNQLHIVFDDFISINGFEINFRDY